MYFLHRIFQTKLKKKKSFQNVKFSRTCPNIISFIAGNKKLKL